MPPGSGPRRRSPCTRTVSIHQQPASTQRMPRQLSRPNRTHRWWRPRSGLKTHRQSFRDIPGIQAVVGTACVRTTIVTFTFRANKRRAPVFDAHRMLPNVIGFGMPVAVGVDPALDNRPVAHDVRHVPNRPLKAQAIPQRSPQKSRCSEDCGVTPTQTQVKMCARNIAKTIMPISFIAFITGCNSSAYLAKMRFKRPSRSIFASRSKRCKHKQSLERHPWKSSCGGDYVVAYQDADTLHVLQRATFCLGLRKCGRELRDVSGWEARDNIDEKPAPQIIASNRLALIHQNTVSVVHLKAQAISQPDLWNSGCGGGRVCAYSGAEVEDDI